MEYNNRTILITGLVIASIVAMVLNFQDIALAIVSGLVGYLSKDVVPIDSNTSPIEDDISPVSDQVSPTNDEVVTDDEVA